MSVVAEVRKAIQDFLAPELRAMKAKLEGIEKRMDSDKADLLRAIQDGTRHIGSRISDLMEMTRVRERLAVIEERQRAAH